MELQMDINSPLFLEQVRAMDARLRARAAERDRNRYLIGRGDLLGVDQPDRVRKFLARRDVPPSEIDRLMAQTHKTDAPASKAIMGAGEPDGLERVLGTSDLMGVAFLAQGLSAARTVGRIWVDIAAGGPAGYGTGFLISPRLLITNHHVLEAASDARTSSVEFDYQLGVDGVAAPTAMFRLDPDSFFITSQDLDYSVTAVQPIAANGRTLTEFGFNPLIAEEGKAIAAQYVNIIQHPGGGYKQLALRENRLIDVFDAFLTYQTDTAPGSSGSPIYNDRWEVVGLHHAGKWAEDAQGRKLAIDGSLWTPDMGEGRLKWIANEGIRVSRLVADLQARATGPGRPLLDELLFAAERAQPQRPISPAAPTQGSVAQTATPAVGSATGVSVSPDGLVTWTIPLSVSVRLGGAAVPIATAAADPALIAATPKPPEPASAPQGDVEAAVAEARATLGARPDVFDVRAGYVFQDGWITRTPAVVVKVRKRLAPAELSTAGVTALPRSVRGVPVEVIGATVLDLLDVRRPGAAEALSVGLGEEIVYQPPPGASLPAFTKVKMKLSASVSPDRGWPMLREFLEGTRKRLVVGMYDFTAPHIAKAITNMGQKAGFKKMILAIQPGSSGGHEVADPMDGKPSDSKTIAKLQAALGDRLAVSWVKVNINTGWVATSYHIKVAVRDQKAFWLSSGNWQSSNQPDADPFNENPQRRSWLTGYNRDWHVVIEHEGLAQVFETYLQNDFDRNLALGAGPEVLALPDVAIPGALLAVPAEEAVKPFEYFAWFEADREFTVQPLLTPDNYQPALIALIRSARRELLIQNQTFDVAAQDTSELGQVLKEVIARQRAGVDVKIIFRILMAPKARQVLEALQNHGFDMRGVRVQANLHTKGVVVDRERVMIGSQNISKLGITLNRDASLLFDDPPLAAYFARVFDHDWTNLARQDIGSQDHAPELLAAGDPLPDGMVRLPLKDILETA
jgi:V8-like Glu-specific endopeptidase